MLMSLFKLQMEVQVSLYKYKGPPVWGAVPALANAGPDCDPCGGPLKVIVQSKKVTNFWYINVS